MTETNKNNKMIAVTVLLLSMMQMAPTGLSPMLAGVSKAFPEASAQNVQFLMTMPGIFVVFFSLLSAWLVRKCSKKLLILGGCMCFLLAAVLALLFHGSLYLLWVWSAILGTGMGIVSALAISLITDYFDGSEKAGLMGLQSCANNLGAMVMSLAGGVLASAAWYMNYFVLLLILPGLICCLLFIPRDNVQKQVPDSGSGSRKIAVNGIMIRYALLCMAFLVCFNAVPANLSMLIAEDGTGNAMTAGIASAVSLLGGIVSGLLFEKMDRRLHLYTLPAGFLCLCAGTLGIAFSRGMLPLLFIGCFVAGFSISLVVPQSIMRVTRDADPAQAALGTAMIMSGSNLGNFLTPVLAAAAAGISGSSRTVYRYDLSAGTACVLGVVLLAVTGISSRRCAESGRG